MSVLASRCLILHYILHYYTSFIMNYMVLPYFLSLHLPPQLSHLCLKVVPYS